MYGDIIRELRRRRGLTQATLAEVSGIDQPNISAIEQGRRIPSVETFHRLVFACGFEVVVTAGPQSIAVPPPAGDPFLDELQASPVLRPDVAEENRPRLVTEAIRLAGTIASR